MQSTNRSCIAPAILEALEGAVLPIADRQTAVIDAARDLLIESWLRRRAGALMDISPAFRRLVARLAELDEAEDVDG